jgi:hypothetical protein
MKGVSRHDWILFVVRGQGADKRNICRHSRNWRERLREVIALNDI